MYRELVTWRLRGVVKRILLERTIFNNTEEKHREYRHLVPVQGVNREENQWPLQTC